MCSVSVLELHQNDASFSIMVKQTQLVVMRPLSQSVLLFFSKKYFDFLLTKTKKETRNLRMDPDRQSTI